MSSSITKAVVLLMLIGSTARADNIGSLRTRLNIYLADPGNLMVDTTTKNNMLNAAMKEYAGMFPVMVDVFTMKLDSAERMDTLPSTYAGQVLSVHKYNELFTEIQYIPGDSIPPIDPGAPAYYTNRQRTLVFYPPPIGPDSVAVFYTNTPSTISGSTECPILDYLEEPIVLLATSKIFLAYDSRSDLADKYYAMFMAEAERLTRTQIERPKP